ncbi:MAG: Coenzyme F420 hydrogenase/dehydrogenase, beta subunit C-terminal domain [Chloroflexota bacterium]
MPISTKPDHAHWRDLYYDVVQTGLCTGCSGCVVVCPHQVLDYKNLTPFQMLDTVDNCVHGEKGCDTCARACPRIGYGAVDIDKLLFGREKQAHELCGIYDEIVFARTRDPRVLERTQDGGIASTLAIWALESGQIDGVLTSSNGANWHPLDSGAYLATDAEGILAGGMSRYTYVPTPLPLKQAVKDGYSKLALMAVPCQTEFVRKLMTTKVKKYHSRVALIIGLLCSETFEFEPFITETMVEKRGIDPKDVRKINIKGKVIVYPKDGGEPVSIPLKEVRPMARSHCHHCPDFTAEHADISLGGLGQDGWTLTLVRTEVGHTFWDGLKQSGLIEVRPAEDEPQVLELMDKLAIKSRKRVVVAGDTWYEREQPLPPEWMPEPVTA